MPTVMKLKILTFEFPLYTYGFKTLNRVVTYKCVILGLGSSSSPIIHPFILQYNPSFKVSYSTLYNIFFEFGLHLPSCYVQQEHIWTKLAPDSPHLGVYILNCRQSDKMQQLFWGALMVDFENM